MDTNHLYEYSYKNPHTQDVIRTLISHIVADDTRVEMRFANMLWATLTQKCHEYCSYLEASKVAELIVADMKLILFDYNCLPPERWSDEVWNNLKYILNTCTSLQEGSSSNVSINLVAQNYGGNVGGSGNNVW